MPTDGQNALLEQALAYSRQGWHVFPCEPPIAGDDTSGKSPLTANGKDDATTDELIIRAWWTQHPNANIGVACAPSGLIVLDVDISDGKGGARSLGEIADQLPDTCKAKTGSGGLHAIYLRGDAEPRQSIGVRDGLDIIGKGYFIAAPSRHWSGGSYSWINSIPPVAQPEILKTIQRIGRAPREPLKSGERIAMADRPARIVAASLIADAFPAKTRHMAFFALAGALAQEGWAEDEVTDFCEMVARLLPYASDTDRSKALDDRASQARDSCAKVERGEEVAGWGILSTFIPQATIDAVHERLGITNHGYDWSVNTTIDLGPLGTITPAQIDAEVAKLDPRNPTVLWIGDLAEREFPPVLSYATPYQELDRLLGGGISTQMLTILLGKPGAGKTALFMSLALHFACVDRAEHVPTLYVSTELQHNELVARLASPLLRAPWRDIVRGKAFKVDGTLITHKDCAAVLKHYKIAVIAQDAIYEAGDRAVELIARTAQAAKAKIVMVDYLQELARGDDAKARQQNTKVAVTFRMLSQRLDCAFFAVSSVSRLGYGAKAKELREADDPEVYLALAKESGDIDYAAATIAFLDVGEERDGNGWRMGRMAVAKSRHGETGFAGMRFNGAFGLWESFGEAVRALSEESRSGARAEKQITDLESRILGKVRELSLLGEDVHGNSQLKGKTELKVLIGGNATQTSVAIDRLIREGKIHERVEETQNPLTKKLSVRKVIALPPEGSVAPAPETPMDVASALAGIVGAPRA